MLFFAAVGSLTCSNLYHSGTFFFERERERRSHSKSRQPYYHFLSFHTVTSFIPSFFFFGGGGGGGRGEGRGMIRRYDSNHPKHSFPTSTFKIDQTNNSKARIFVICPVDFILIFLTWILFCEWRLAGLDVKKKRLLACRTPRSLWSSAREATGSCQASCETSRCFAHTVPLIATHETRLLTSK